MIHGRNIVCVASNWFEHPTSKHHLMRILSHDNHVVWVNYHASRRPRVSVRDGRTIIRRLREAMSGPRRVQSSLEVLSPPLIPWPTSQVARAVNARLITAQVRHALARQPRRPTQLWLFTPDAPELIERGSWERVVYYCVDDFAGFEGFDPALITRLERRTCDAADVVIATSEPLLAHCRTMHADPQLVPHGVDVEHFATALHTDDERIPVEVRALPRPILGYFGLLAEYVDVELLAEIARRRPDWTIVLVGAERCDLAALDGLSNVRRLGGRPYEELPGYCAAFDIGLIPFRVNRLTHAANPIKLREYLAAGLPVASTPMPAVRDYASAVRIGAGPGGFMQACEAALQDARNEPRARRSILVAGESWASRVKRLGEILAQSRPKPDIIAQPTPAG